MPPDFLVDPGSLELGRVVADKEAIRRAIPQRFEMEQLDAVTWIDSTNHVIVGYRDIRADEFWVRGHMPGYALFPGVLMCEAAAQLCGFYVAITRVPILGEFLGFGGMENVRFRSPVHPGDRLVLVGKAHRLRPRQTMFAVQGFVGSNLAFHGDILGVPMSSPAKE